MRYQVVTMIGENVYVSSRLNNFHACEYIARMKRIYPCARLGLREA